MFVEFDGRGSSKKNWFDQHKMLSSSYYDLPYSGTMLYDSIEG